MFFVTVSHHEDSTVEERRLCCLEEVQQDVSTSKWTGKEPQQWLYPGMKPVLVQKRRRCSASQVADF